MPRGASAYPAPSQAALGSGGHQDRALCFTESELPTKASPCEVVQIADCERLNSGAVRVGWEMQIAWFRVVAVPVVARHVAGRKIAGTARAWSARSRVREPSASAAATFQPDTPWPLSQETGTCASAAAGFAMSGRDTPRP